MKSPKFSIKVNSEGIQLEVSKDVLTEKEIRELIHELSCSLFELHELMRKKGNVDN